MIENMVDAVSLARQGSDEGKAYLYESTYRKAYYVALKHMKNEDDACDVVQDAYIKAFDRIDQLADDGKFDSWLNTIVASTALDALKKKKPMLFSQMSKEDDEDYDVSERFEADYSKQPEVVIDQNETSRLVQEIIGELSDEQRVCVTMYYIQEMSVKEISSVLDVPDNTVMSRLHYARKNIEKKVKELEKKGTKLYALAPIPFLLLLLHSEADACEATAVAGLYSETVGTESSINSGAMASTGASTGATASGMSLGVKIAIGISAIAVVIGGVFGIKFFIHYNSVSPEIREVAEQFASSSSKKEWAEAYHAAISNDSALGISWKDNRVYVLDYVDDDDIPELLNCEGTIQSGAGVFTYKNGNTNGIGYPGCHIEYVPKQGLVHFYGDNESFEIHNIRQLNDANFEELVSVAFKPADPSNMTYEYCYLNGQMSNKEEAANALATAFGNCSVSNDDKHIVLVNNSAKRVNSEHALSYDDMLALLEYLQ